MRRFSFQPLEVLIILSSFILVKAEFLELTDSRIATPQQLRSLRPCFVEGYWEDPDDCRRFYRCVNYGTSESSPLLFRHDFDCAPGTIFDTTYGICNHPLRVTNRRSSCVFPLQLQLLHQFQEYSPRGSPTASSFIRSNSNLNSDNIETDSNVNAEPDSNSILGLRSNFGGSRRQGKSRKFTIPPALAASPYNRIQIPVQFLPDNYYTYGEPTILTNPNTNTNSNLNTNRYGSTNFNLNLKETQPLFSSKSSTDEDDDGLFKIKSSAAVQGKFSRRILEKLERQRAENENINSSIQTIVQKDDETIRKKLFGGRKDSRDSDESQEGEFSENVTVSTLPDNNNNNNNIKKKNNTSLDSTSNSKYFTTSARENVVSLLPFKRYQVQIPYTK